MWLYMGQPFNQEACYYASVGFVYLIKNLTNGKMYVGKKLFTKSKAYQKNKKRKKKRVDSDWELYTGSNEQLNLDIASGHQIEKHILWLCPTKGWMTYYETKEILNRDCLLSDDYYNQWVSCKIRRSHLKEKTK